MARRQLFGTVPRGGGISARCFRLESIVIPAVNGSRAHGPARAFVEMRKGQQWRVNAMQELIEYYEMVSINVAVLRGSQRKAILEARRALHAFARALEKLQAASTELDAVEGRSFKMAA